MFKTKIKPNYFATMQGHREITRKNSRVYTIRNQRDRFFFPDEWMAFNDNLKPKQQITFNTLLNTGARIMEARNIQVRDIDFERRNIVLRVTKRIVNRPGKEKKGIRKIRVLTISSKFAKYLKKVILDRSLQSEDYIPILSTPAANIALKKTLKKVGIKDYKMFSVHNIRKTSEMWLLSLDVDSFKVIKHFGHSSAIALKHYLSSDVFNWEDKRMIRQIMGDIYEK